MKRILALLTILLSIQIFAQNTNTIYSESFSSDPFNSNGFTKFEKSNYSASWNYSSARGTLETSSGAIGVSIETWAITPAIRMEAGNKYTLSFDTKRWGGTADYECDIYAFLLTSNQSSQIKVKPLEDEPLASANITYKTSNENYTTKKATFTVDQTQDYYIGFVYAMKKTVGSGSGVIDNVKVVQNYPTPEKIANTDIVITAVDKGALSSTLKWKNPTQTTDGEPISALTNVKIYRGTRKADNVVATLTGEEYLKPGAELTYIDSGIPVAGYYIYKIVTTIDKGTSDASDVQSPWIGKDSDIKDFGSLSATVGTQGITLNFGTPVGTHGGYVAPEDMYYKIERKFSGQSNDDYLTLEEAYNSTELSFIDETAQMFNVYTYRVTPTYKTDWGDNSFGSGMVTANVSFSGVGNVPYIEGFNDKNTFSFFTVAEGDTYITGEWGWEDYTLKYTEENDAEEADLWLFTPNISLEKGVYYKLECDAWVKDPDAARSFHIGYRIPILTNEPTILNSESDYTISDTEPTKFSFVFCPDITSNYNICFHVFGEANQNELYLDNISLVELPLTASPAENLTVTPDPHGQVGATIEWTNPSTDFMGKDISSLASVSLLRNSEVIYTKEQPLPGESESYYDSPEESVSGEYKYTIVAYMKEEPSEAAETTVWLGKDIPGPGSEVVVVSDNDDPTVEISFTGLDPETGGVHGGYIGEVSYDVMRMPESFIVVENTETTTVYDTDIASEKLAVCWYEIAAVSDNVSGVAVASEKVLTGNYMKLLDWESFSFDYSTDEAPLWWINADELPENRRWTHNLSKEWMEVDNKIESTLYTCKFYLYAGTYRLTYKAWVQIGGMPSKIDIFYSDKTSNVSADDFQATQTVSLLDDSGSSNNITLIESINPRISNDGPSSPNAAEFTVSEPGTYYIGFHKNPSSPYGNFTLRLNSVALTAVDIKTGIPTGVEDAESFASTMAYDASRRMIIGLPEAVISVYSLDGKLVIQAIADGNLSVKDLPSGIYIARCGASTLKFVK